MVTKWSKRLMNYIRLLSYRELSYSERIRLKRLPRYCPTVTRLFDKKFELVDACTFFIGLNEIFMERIYEFNASTDKPLIIDCGANIGLSVIYFKKLYPGSKIIAFEADKKIFSVLQRNLSEFGFSNVELHNKAVWDSEKIVDFKMEGGYSGRIAKVGDTSNLDKVNTVRLRNILD